MTLAWENLIKPGKESKSSENLELTDVFKSIGENKSNSAPNYSTWQSLENILLKSQADQVEIDTKSQSFEQEAITAIRKYQSEIIDMGEHIKGLEKQLALYKDEVNRKDVIIKSLRNQLAASPTITYDNLPQTYSESSLNRKSCPKCNSTSIKEIDDRSSILSYINNKPLYRKKLACKKCSFEWN